MKELRNAYIESYGCSANKNNSEIIAGLLQQVGLNVVKNLKIADIAIISTCIVKGPTEQRMRDRIERLSKIFSERLIVSGCMPDVESGIIQSLAPSASQIGSHNISKICSAVKEISEGRKSLFLSKGNEVKLCLPKSNQNSVIGITQISEGCVGNCSYCITKFAKGNLFSYPKEKILQNIKQDLQSGCKEIWITSQDNAAYGLDRGRYMLPELLDSILSIKGKFMLRIGMMNPNHLKNILEKMLEYYENEKMFKFLHLPLQSGSNKILKDMNREYKAEDFIRIVKVFREKFPSVTIATDIITGYPTESDDDFRKSMEIVKEIKPDMLNISKFWPHDRTPASELKQLKAGIVKKRASELMNIHLDVSLAQNMKLVGKNFECLIDNRGFWETVLARNRDYKLVALNGRNLLGKYLNVGITEAMPHYLIGRINSKKSG
ncbi:MAG: tRNA (N(6)-L-threonylcarbamoyladenosine(37)-C(2))-methylthiotransferase [archaeon]